jgi:hypothetical protein
MRVAAAGLVTVAATAGVACAHLPSGAETRSDLELVITAAPRASCAHETVVLTTAMINRSTDSLWINERPSACGPFEGCELLLDIRDADDQERIFMSPALAPDTHKPSHPVLRPAEKTSTTHVIERLGGPGRYSIRATYHGRKLPPAPSGSVPVTDWVTSAPITIEVCPNRHQPSLARISAAT